jgi:(p)ppGpp synthase/HD superfamily hydrolase
VAEVLTSFGFSIETDPYLMIGAWLHDSIEDTDLTKHEVEAEFGSDVADIVWRVTDEAGGNRKERKARTYPKTRESEDAIILKLADRIANVESSLVTGGDLLHMYRKEHAYFTESLRPFSTKEKALEMWAHLNGLLAIK